ncbi:glycosyl transferase [Geodermatophilus sp. TF02-6]|uniref:glycosyltransferase family 2 protein n=1 Tax=Geodermatophilus sp. TF02-6 TaxID=2250575 RepID=UPI000DE81C91|nr:glycosyltransferase [Geodermatophilus sp. TF02-6]RBY75283.1 glycosyl transferase [Geodermatophilus sp. TF02-6]
MTSVSVVIPCFTEERWEEITRAVRSVLEQTHPCDVIVVVDHDDVLLDRLRRAVGHRARVVPNRFARGASGGRNTGALVAGSDLLVFMDDDEVAEPDWVENLVRAHRRAPFAVGLGGAVEARWPGGAPHWFPEEFSWTVGGTAPRPDDTDVRNVWGGNMAVRRDLFLQVGGFANEFGKVGHASQPEDTELCLRMNAHVGTGARWRFVPGAVISHDVPPERRTFRFFLRRNWLEGTGKRVMASRSATGGKVLDEEAAFVRAVLTRGLLRNLVVAARGDLGGLARTGATVLGVGAAALGYLAAAVRPVRAGERRRDVEEAVRSLPLIDLSAPAAPGPQVQKVGVEA